jgi:hypothetical protein
MVSSVGFTKADPQGLQQKKLSKFMQSAAKSQVSLNAKSK